MLFQGRNCVGPLGIPFNNDGFRAAIVVSQIYSSQKLLPLPRKYGSVLATHLTLFVMCSLLYNFAGFVQTFWACDNEFVIFDSNYLIGF